MRIFIRPATEWPTELRELIERRLQFALGRFGSRIRSLSVRLSDLNGPRGGVDKKCLVAVRLSRPAKLIVIEDVDSQLDVVVGRVAERTARAVSRAVQTTSDWRSPSS